MTSIKNLVTTASTCLGKTFITCISYIHHHHWWLPGDLFHLLDSSNAIKNHEGERFPSHDIVYDKAFAPGIVVCHPVIELSKASQCHQIWPMSSSMTSVINYDCHVLLQCVYSLPSWLRRQSVNVLINFINPTFGYPEFSDHIICSRSKNSYPPLVLYGRDHSIHWTMMISSAQNPIIKIVFC